MFESRKKALSEGFLVVGEITRKKNHANVLFIGSSLIEIHGQLQVLELE